MQETDCNPVCIVCGNPVLPGRKVCSPSCSGALAAVYVLNANLVQQINVNYQPKPASWWTHARPGSAEKIAVLRWRYEHGEELFHPNDFTVLDQPHA